MLHEVFPQKLNSACEGLFVKLTSLIPYMQARDPGGVSDT